MVNGLQDHARLEARTEAPIAPGEARASAAVEQAMRSMRSLAVVLARQAAREDDAVERGCPAQTGDGGPRNLAQAARPGSTVDK
jgi:hypothetical protein